MARTVTGRARWALVPLVAAAALGACGSEAGDDVVAGDVDFEATGQFLAAASERSAGEAYRFESSMAMEVAADGEELFLDAAILTGEQDGRSFEYHMDMAEWMAQVPGAAAALGGGDLTMDMVGDGQALYIRAPIYAAMAEQAGPGGIGPIGELATLGDRWGRADLTALEDLSFADLQGTAGASSSSDPRAMLDAVARADDVEELGTDEVGGTPVNGLGARLSLRELLEAQGVDAERYIDQLGANVGGLNRSPRELTDEVMQRVFTAEIPFEVWIDGDGYVRRLSYEMDALAIFAEMDGFPADRLDRFATGQTTDYFDYGADVIAIDLPAEAVDAVDVTDAYRRMLEAGQGGS